VRAQVRNAADRALREVGVERLSIVQDEPRQPPAVCATARLGDASHHWRAGVGGFACLWMRAAAGVRLRVYDRACCTFDEPMSSP